MILDMQNQGEQNNQGQNQNKKKITIILADDHPLMRDSVRGHLESQSDIEIIAEACNGEEAVELASRLVPDLVIMDIAMPKMNGLEATQQIKLNNPKIAILVLTVHTDSEYILKILEAGAAGYITKDIVGEKLIPIIHSVINGESVFSNKAMERILKYALKYTPEASIPVRQYSLHPRELEILRLAAKGMSNKAIASQLNLNVQTVKSYFVSIFDKLAVSSRTEAVITGLRKGLLTNDDIR